MRHPTELLAPELRLRVGAGEGGATRVASPSSPLPATAQAVGLPWLLRLRWGAVAGQLLALAAAHFVLALDLPWLALVGLVGVTALTNAFLGVIRPSPRASARILLGLLVVDAALLTAMLLASGGPTNPFTIFYLVQIALAALLLRPRAAWGLGALTVLAFGSLFLLPTSPLGGHVHEHGSPWSMHFVGMWVSYSLAAGFVAYFIQKVSQAMRDRDRDLAEVAHLALQNERLAMLSAFSATAAHELGTPLATIGLAADELAAAIAQGKAGAGERDDADLIRREVARSRAILADLSSRAGESVGEMPARTTPRRIVEEVEEALARGRAAVAVRFESDEAALCPLFVPRRTLVQMLVNLVRNALDAQEEAGVDAPVELRVALGKRLSFHVVDRGPGFRAAVVERLGEPFVTTKASLGGLGLGVYLARSFAERLGGSLRYAAPPGGGLDAELGLPLDPARGDR